MNISGLLKILGRHKPIVGTFAALTLAALVAVMFLWPPSYQATSAVVLLNPPAVPVASVNGPPVPDDIQNPYVSFDDLSVVVDVLSRVFDSKEMLDKLKAQGLQGTFEIAANRDFYRGPIIDVAAEAPTPQAAVKATNMVTAELEAQLKSLQASQKIDPNYFIKTAAVVDASQATSVLTGTIRMLIMVGGLGAILTVGSGLLADGIDRLRARRRSGAAGTGGPDANTGPDNNSDGVKGSGGPKAAATPPTPAPAPAPAASAAAVAAAPTRAAGTPAKPAATPPKPTPAPPASAKSGPAPKAAKTTKSGAPTKAAQSKSSGNQRPSAGATTGGSSPTSR